MAMLEIRKRISSERSSLLRISAGLSAAHIITNHSTRPINSSICQNLPRSTYS